MWCNKKRQLYLTPIEAQLSFPTTPPHATAPCQTHAPHQKQKKEERKFEINEGEKRETGPLPLAAPHSLAVQHKQSVGRVIQRTSRIKNQEQQKKSVQMNKVGAKYYN